MLKVIRDARRWLASLPLRVGIESGKTYDGLPSPVHSVLFVCKGNICRSPLAAAYFAAKLSDLECPIEIHSGGLDTTAGKEADPLASAVAQENALSLDAHVTRPLTQELIDRADLILVMEVVHRSELLQKYPSAEGKVFQLGDFNNMLSREINDPYGGTRADFEFCYESIRRSCDGLLKRLVAR
jgi:protein-tyrosine phosphatase